MIADARGYTPPRTVSVLRTIVSSSRALITTAKDAARFKEIAQVFISHGFGWAVSQLKLRRELQVEHDHPNEDVTALALAETHAAAGHRAAAGEWLDRAAQLAPGDPRVSALRRRLTSP